MTNKEILAGIASALGIDELNPMQKVIAQSDRRKFILLSPTGSGKTVAFAIAMLKALGKPCGKVQALVLAPSRELVLQIAEVIRPVAVGYKTTALYGGHSVADEVSSLSVVPDIVVATPGRLLDHIERRHIDVRAVSALVLDEYDKSLELGFLDQMRRIIRRISSPSTVILTSATAIDTLPDFISMDSAKVYDFVSGAESPRQRTDIAEVSSPGRDKLDTLVCLLRSLPDGKVIVFVNHRESVERVYGRLAAEGLPVGFYHGGLDQQKREMAIDMLDNGTTPILVATDLGARGLDIDSVSAVIHYHIPPSPESWTHRNGRTARAGASGDVYVITGPGEKTPDYVVFDRDADISTPADNPIRASKTTLYIDAGKKEKISRGDVAGYLIAAGNLPPEAIGRIIVKDHASYAAVDRSVAGALLEAVKGRKLKNRRVRVTVAKP